MPTTGSDHRRRTRLHAALLAWVLVLLAATAVGLTAVGAIGDGIIGVGQRPLTEREVQDQLRAAAAARPLRVADDAVRSPGSTVPVVLASRGGTVLAACRGEVVEVVSASPAQGFRVHDRDEDDRDKVKFESDAEDIKVKLRLSCVGGTPRAAESIEID